MNICVIWCHMLRACEIIQIFICKLKTTIIMLKLLCATIQNLVIGMNKCVVFVYPCPRLQHGIVIHKATVLNILCSD